MDNMKLSDNELNLVSGGAGAMETIASGTFSSNSGTSLDLLVSWSVVADSLGQRTLCVSVSATSYSLVSVELYNGEQMTLNGVTYSANSRPINYHGTTMVTNPLADFTVPNYQGPASVSVVFHFNGTLSGRPVNDIIAYGTITV